jgi:Calx-beta domain/Domain of unknown function DUF11
MVPFLRSALATALFVSATTLSAVTFTVTSTSDSGPGSLRQAIIDANTIPGTDNIAAAPGLGPIRPLSSLPPVMETTYIDGFVLEGQNAGAGATGIELNNNSVLSRSTVNGFSGDGVHLSSGLIWSCFIGTDPKGIVAIPNENGVVLSGHNVRVGTSAPGVGYGNVISGNRGHGVLAVAGGGHQFTGNFIGTNRAGASLGNGGDGIHLSGGTTGNSNFNIPENVIAHNGGSGVAIEGPGFTHNYVLGRIFDNGGMAFDLGADGPTPNDPGDADDGPNHLLNYFELSEAVEERGRLVVTGTLETTPGTTMLLTFYRCSKAGAGGRGDEIDWVIGGTEVTAGADGIVHLNHAEVGTATVASIGAYVSVMTRVGDTDMIFSELSNAVKLVSAPPVLQFESPALELRSNATAVIRVVRDGGYSNPASIRYSTHDGTALAGRDYVATTGTLSFAAGESVKQFTIQGIAAATPMADRQLTITLDNPSTGAITGTPATLTATITDGVMPTITAQPLSVTEGNGGTTDAVVNVTLAAPATQAFSVNYATADGTALAGSDYLATSGTLSFAAGATSASCVVKIIGDTIWETTETFRLLLTGSMKTYEGVITIRDNDEYPGVFQFFGTFQLNSEESAIRVTVIREFGAAGTVSIPWRLVAGTALPGLDYVDASGTLTFADQETSKTIQLQAINDTLPEIVENFTVELGQPSAGSLGDRATTSIFIFDRDGDAVKADAGVTLDPVAGPVHQGDLIPIRFNITNNGPAAATQVVLNMTATGGAVPESATAGAGASASVSSTGVLVRLDRLEKGASLAGTVLYRLTSSGRSVIGAGLTIGEELNGTNNTASISLDVLPGQAAAPSRRRASRH